jgi:glycosyltransferase involved in cell wall biosynthesis
MMTDASGARGKERRLVKLLAGLSNEQSIQIDLIVFGDSFYFDEIFNYGICIHFVPREKRNKFNQQFKLFRLISRLKPELIHSWGIMPSLYSILISKILHIPLIDNHIADASPKNNQKFSKQYFQKKLIFLCSNKIVSNSMAGLDIYHAPPQKSLCIHNGFSKIVTDSGNAQNTTKPQFNIETKYLVAMVAEFCSDKDYSTYFKAARIVLDKRRDVTFMAIGEGEEMNYHIASIENRYRRRILFPGRLKNIYQTLANVDIGILTTYTEGISNALLEFMAASVPVIATGGGGTKELIQHDLNGFLYPVGEVPRIAEKIQYLLDNSEYRNEIGISGLDTVQSKFSIDTMIKKYIQLYENQKK